MTFPTSVRSTALAAITFVALILFAAVFGLLIVSSVQGEIPKWVEGDFPTSMATALAGLVGGVVAIGLGQTPRHRVSGRYCSWYCEGYGAGWYERREKGTLSICLPVRVFTTRSCIHNRRSNATRHYSRCCKEPG
jgi:hypothetical protein